MLTRLTSLAALLTLSLAACVTDTDIEDDDISEGGDEGKADGANPAVPNGHRARFPIMLVHGFHATPTEAGGGFGQDVVRALCADGHAVFVPVLPPVTSVANRSAALAQAIDTVLAGATDACGRVPAIRPTKVNLIAHSMGGLDSRAVVATRGYGDRVASVITISTPHRGTSLADAAISLEDDPEAWGALGTLIRSQAGTSLSNDPNMRAALTSLSEAHAPTFNAANPNDHRVRYESWAGLSSAYGVRGPLDRFTCEYKMGLFPSANARHSLLEALHPAAFLVGHGFDFRPNDGVVMVASAKWGRFRGCMPADHADEISAMPSHQFEHVRFMRNRAFELATYGF